ncbi:MAG TPA: hypothetical protein VGQ83_12280 [Polyangia bacterium]|jgi:hypothetical protein
MLFERAERVERAFWMWRLRLTRVAALLPASVATGAAALGVLLADLVTVGSTRPPARARARARAQAPAAPPAHQNDVAA